MSEPAPHRLDYDAYLALERDSGTRHEFLDGEVQAMSGGSLRHSAIKVNLAALLRTGLRGGACRAYDSDARLRVVATGLATYADFAVVCGPTQTHPEDPQAFVNPTALIEVLSPTTEAWDRGGKFLHAQQIPSLQLYVLVSQDRALIEVYERQDGGWWYTPYTAGEIPLGPLRIALPIDEVYADLPDP